MKYTDKELIRASQIAYCRINHDVINDITKWLKQEEENNHYYDFNYTLSELYNHSDTFKRSVYKNICINTGLDYDEGGVETMRETYDYTKLAGVPAE